MTDSNNLHPTSAMLPSDALAAAVAAAAELARNGGDATTLFRSLTSPANPPNAVLRSNPFFMNNLPATASPQDGAILPPPSIASVFNENNENGNSSVATTAFPYAASSQPDDNDIVDDEHDDEVVSDEDDNDDSERRVARSRERNREHARRTRLRKKAQLEALQLKVQKLQAESKVLQQKLEECHIASILVGLSSGSQDSLIQELVAKANECQDKGVVQLVGKRKRFVVTNGDGTDMEETGNEASNKTQPLQIRIDGKLTRIGGGRTHINWKSGVYSDEEGTQRKLSREQLESLRRERNRMHAKMTRDRKKNFIATIETTIEDLECNNARMREVVTQIGSNKSPSPTPVQPQLRHDQTEEDLRRSSGTPQTAGGPPSMPSPSLSSVVSHDEAPPALTLDRHSVSLATKRQKQQRPVRPKSDDDESPIPTKRSRHGFSLASF